MEIRKKYGSFGNLSVMYDKARRGMPEEVLDYLFSMLPTNPKVLDLGCGTGIVTRQIKERGADVIGADRDSQMLEKALAYTTQGIAYVQAEAKKLPFEDAIFDGVTAFSAFHWFATLEPLTEIQRTMKKRGLFFIANRKAQPDHLTGYKAVLRPFAESDFPPPREYKYAELFESAGLKEVVEKKFPLTENYTIDESVEYIQSTSPWNLVKEDKKEEAKEALKQYFAERTNSGIFEKKVWIVTCCGRKGS